MNIKRINVKDLNANDSFCLPGNSTVYTVESRHTDGPRTRVTYTLGSYRGEFVKVNLSSVDLLEV